MEENELELRAYFFVPYNISDIQKGVQGIHTAFRFARLFGSDENFINFVDKHETVIILNGGTTNARRDFEGFSFGTLNQIADQLLAKDIPFSYFTEPDLNDALTALCFIADERVFNREVYPDFVNWLLKIKMYQEAADEAQKKNPALWVELRLKSAEEHQELFPEYYKEWVRFLGGEKNVFLRELISDKKLA
jgi:hypothetical protein